MVALRVLVLLLLAAKCSPSGAADLGDLRGVQSVLERYVVAFQQGDEQALRDIFAKESIWLGKDRNGEVGSASASGLLPAWASRPDPRTRIILSSIQFTSPNLAVAAFTLEYSGVTYRDQLNLMKLGGEWKVVAKVTLPEREATSR